MLPFDEIAVRLVAEGITPEEFVRELFDGGRHYPDDPRLAWLGRVDEVDRDHHNATSQELEHETVVFYLPAHGLYLRTHGVNEPDAHGQPVWEYDPLRPCQPEQQIYTYTTYV